MPRWDFAHVQDDVNPHLLHMLEGTFSLDAVRIGISAAGTPVFTL